MSKKSKNEKIDEIKAQENAFRSFFNDSKSIFTNLQIADASSHEYQNRCILNICPGSRAGGNEQEIIDIFWGSQPIKRIDKKNGFSTLCESGVSMLINQLPDGHINITLYPAKTDVMQPIEDCIFLRRFCKATWLNKKNSPKSLWRDFMAYTECTSLIGTPSLFQRLRVFWLKYTRPLCINGVQQPIKVLTHIRKVISFALTVGLSGFILIAVQHCNKEESKDYTRLIEQVNTTLDDALQKQSELNQEVDHIKVDVDSLLERVPRLK